MHENAFACREIFEGTRRFTLVIELEIEREGRGPDDSDNPEGNQ